LTNSLMRTAYLLIILALFAACAQAATISGSAYEWGTLRPLGGVVFDITSIPPQTIVGENGTYSFALPNGKYTLTARYYENNALRYATQKNITINTDGDYTLDLILSPVADSNQTPIPESNMFNVPSSQSAEIPKGLLDTLAIILLLGAFAAIIYGAKRIAKKTGHLIAGDGGTTQNTVGAEMPRKANAAGLQFPSNEQKAPAGALHERMAEARPYGLRREDTELAQVIGILRNAGGRMTQKELREKLPHSEAKTSLLVAELEDSGMLKKFRHGRGNILVLREERDMQETARA